MEHPAGLLLCRTEPAAGLLSELLCLQGRQDAGKLRGAFVQRAWLKRSWVLS